MINSSPIVSVITVVYNDVLALETTIQNVVNQTYSNIEFIIIDGGSTDGTIDIIKKYSDRISFWISEPDKGIYDAMNKGVNHATGQWINFMNAGDWFYSATTIESLFEEDTAGIEMIYGKTEKRTDTSSVICVPGNKHNFWKKARFHQSIFSRADLNRQYPFTISYTVSADFDFLYKVFINNHVTQYRDQVISSYNIDGFSHHNRFLGFSQARQIALQQFQKPSISLQVYLHYALITMIGKTLDLAKRINPKLYKRLQSLKR